MTTEHDEGFKAGIEAAAKYAIEGAWRTSMQLADGIRALKPAPRSAEHTAEPAVQCPRCKGEGVDGEDDSERGPVFWLCETCDGKGYLATAPSTRIEAEPVGEVEWIKHLACIKFYDQENPQEAPEGTKLYLAPSDRTPGARSTSDAAVLYEFGLNGGRRICMACNEDDDECDVCHGTGFLADRATRSTSDAAVVLPEVSSFPAWLRFDRTSKKEHFDRWLDEERTSAVLADRATRSTDSSAEAAGMERAAKLAEQYQWAIPAHAKAARQLATSIRAEAAKLTTAPHTADETQETK